ncbi:MAG: hypothetical protein K940chlam2_01725, partial [Chlamydiae bacterium]|nr:hypothetical protein [Chlamydiota bacterium]
DHIFVLFLVLADTLLNTSDVFQCHLQKTYHTTHKAVDIWLSNQCMMINSNYSYGWNWCLYIYISQANLWEDRYPYTKAVCLNLILLFLEKKSMFFL